MRRKVTICIICLLSVALSLLDLRAMEVNADSDNITYSLGSNADISYKKDENKIYYSRMHYSSGSGIRYYTQYFVISLQMADLDDDLSRLEDGRGDCSMIIPVSFGGSSVKENEAEKSGDFYWYDSEPDDDGYIRTTYVMDGSIFLQLLDMAEMTGKKGSIYIHHVFAIAGGSEDDNWHISYKVKNNVPYYKYSDLMKLHWNNTQATQDSQKSCLNIPVPYKRPKNTGSNNKIDNNFFEITPVPTIPLGITATSTPTPIPTGKARGTPTPTPTGKAKGTPTPTPTGKAKGTPTPTPTGKAKGTPTPTPTGKAKGSSTPTPTGKAKGTSTPTPTGKAKGTPTPTPIGKNKGTPVPTSTPSPTPSPTPTPRPEIKLRSEKGELSLIQKIDADIDNTQIVLDSERENTLKLEVLNYDTDVRVSFPFDCLSSDGRLLPAYTWNMLYPYYRIPSDTDEGIYRIKAAAVSETTGLFLSTDEINVEISGKMYGLKLIDNNSMAVEWKDVFRVDGVIKNRVAHLYEDGTLSLQFNAKSRYYYSSGINDRFGNRTLTEKKYTLPVVDGDSPVPVASGMLKSGYTWKFSLKTYGSVMSDTGAHVLIKPSFFYLSGSRECVNLYDGNLNKQGKLIEAVPVSRNGDEVTWEFEYMLPDNWNCISENFELEKYLEKKGGLTFNEDFWKKKGYVAVNFEIGAYSSSGSLVMTYSNTKENVRNGMCDMWSTEGFCLKKKDCFNNIFSLSEGDVILVRIPGSTLDSTGIPSIPTNSSEDKVVSSGKGY